MPSRFSGRLRAVAAFVLAVAVMSGCGGSSTASKAVRSKSKEPIEVVTTAYPVYEAVQAVGGGRVKVDNLLPLTALADEPLTDAQKKKVADADLVVELGKGTQPNVENIAANRAAPTVQLLNGMATQPAAVGVRGEADPYVWMDPTLQARVVELVQGQLASMDPRSAPYFQARASDYRAELANIDRKYAHVLAGCSRKELVTEVPTFGYLTSRYGLKQIVTSGHTDAASDTGESLQEVVAQYKPTTLFATELPSSRSARTLFVRDNVRIAVLDSLADRTDQARRGGANYQSVMKLNLDALQVALGCTDAFGGK